MSFEAMTWAIGHKLPSHQKLVLLLLANRCNHESGMCIPKVKNLAEECGMSERTVQRACQDLEAAGLLKIVRRTHEGVQLSNQYNLHLWVRGALEKPFPPPVSQSHPRCQPDTPPVSQSHPGVSESRTNKPVNKPVKEPTTPGSPPAAPQAPGAASPSDADASGLQATCKLIWAAYRDSMTARYPMVEPLRNAKINSQVRQIAQALPAAEAPEIVRFYVSMNTPYYVRQTHDLGALLKDIVAVRTRWAAAQAGMAMPSAGDAPQRGAAPAFDPHNKDTWGRDARGRFNSAQYVRDEIRATQMLAGGAPRGDVIDAQAREVPRG